jgi:hypothetical protein
MKIGKNMMQMDAKEAYMLYLFKAHLPYLRRILIA